MRTFIACIAVLSLSGCGLEILSTAAIGSSMEAKSASTAARALQYAKDSTSETNAQHAIDLYKGEKGENPPSLEALVPNFLDKLPEHPDGTPYGYDPATGRLLDHPVPVAVAATPAAAVAPSGNDWQTLNELNAAIQKYAKDTGMYPGTLYSLIPTYIKAVPKTASGLDFTYDPRAGAAYLPGSAMPSAAPPVAAAAPRPRGAVGGVGPMGETMTGIGISNQLDSMNNSATSSAGGHAGSSLDRSQDLHNQQQEQALKDAGM